VASAGPYANLYLDPDTTTPASHHSVFYRLDALPAAQPTASNTEGNQNTIKTVNTSDVLYQWRQRISKWGTLHLSCFKASGWRPTAIA